MDIVGIYLFCCDQSAVLEANQICGEINEQNENSASSVRFTNNLLEPHYNIFENVKNKLACFIERLIKALDETKIHWWFCLILDPQYTADLKEIRELHGVEVVHSKTVIFEIKAHFLDYFSDCENVHNPIVAPISSTVQEVIYLLRG